MKRIVTFLLVLVTMVGIIGYSPISAKSKVKDTSPNYYGKGIGASYDFEYNTDTKYKIVVKDADSYKDLAQGEEEYWNSYTKENYCVNYYSSASKIQVQLQLVSTKTGKAVKNSKVKFYGWNYYDEPNPDYLTKDGKFTFHRLPNREDYIDNDIYAVYKNKIYNVAMYFDVKAYDKEVSNQRKIDSDPIKYAPRANPEDHWYLVPKGYALEDYTVYESYLFDKDGNYKETKTKLDDAVYIYSGQKIEWVIKNYDTGEEISVAEAKKGTFKISPLADEPYLPEALSIKKDGKTVKNKKIGSADYLVSVLRVYYDGLVYTTTVIMLPTKADADWCIAHNDYLADFDLYYYCQYKGISTKAWETEHAASIYAFEGLEWEDIEKLESETIEPETVTNTPVEEAEDECELADDYREIDHTKNREITLIPTASGYQIVSYDISEKEAWYQEHYLGNDKWDEYGSWLEHLAEIRGISRSSSTEGSGNGVSIGF